LNFLQVYIVYNGQGDQIGQFFTNWATFCRLIKDIAPK
jgi:hypothetical protein